MPLTLRAFRPRAKPQTAVSRLSGRRYLWEPGCPVVVSVGSFEAFETPDFRRSPVKRAIDTDAAIRLRFAEEGPRTDLTVVNELRAEGATDYLVTPLVFADGAIHAASWATRLLIPGEAAPRFRDDRAPHNGMIPPGFVHITRIRWLRRV
jgi:hypothetical protein